MLTQYTWIYGINITYIGSEAQHIVTCTLIIVCILKYICVFKKYKECSENKVVNYNLFQVPG